MSDNVSKNFLRTYLERQPVKSYNKGEIIFFQGEAPRTAMVIKAGTVKAYNLSIAGDEKPIAFYDEDTVMPISWVYGKAASAIYYFEAFSSKVEVYLVDRHAYVKFIKNRPELLFQEFERLMVNDLGSSLRLNALQHSRASDKLLYTLHYLALTHGKPAKGAQLIEILLDLTHQDFANITGLTRETAATELNKLKKQGIINYGKDQPYTLSLKKLMELQNDQFIADLQPATLQP